MKQLLITLAFTLINCEVLLAQKNDPRDNWVKIDNGQYGFVIGTNEKDSIYFVTVYGSKISPGDREIEVIFTDGKGNKKAQLINEFNLSDRTLALYRYTGKKIRRKQYDELPLLGEQKFFMMAEGLAGNDVKTSPYIPRQHTALYQETISQKNEVYYFGKTGGALERGMVLLNGKNAVVGMVADNNGSAQDRFSIIAMTKIRERLNQADHGACRYFNLLIAGETMTPCEKDKKQKEQQRIAQLIAETERRNRTREEQRIVRRNSDYYLSFGPAVSGNLYTLNGKAEEDKTMSGGGYSVGMNIYVNPNPKKVAVSIRPAYKTANLNMPEDYVLGSASQLRVKKLAMEEYEVPVVFETGGEGLYVGIGYAPAYVKKMSYSYQLAGESPVWKNEILGRAKYLHRLHFELGAQLLNFRLSLAYQYQLGSFINRNYEIIVSNEVIRPFERFDKKYQMISINLSTRLWGQWH